MEVEQNTSRERVFSILNDSSCPSFVFRQKSTSTSPPPPAPPHHPHVRLPSIHSFSPSSKASLERPQYLRGSQYQRTSSVSSVGSPPLLRYDSTSSKSSNSSMDSSPSPITPAYSYNDPATAQYDCLLRQDLGAGYMVSPTTITPYMEQQMLLTPTTNMQLPTFEPKAGPLPPSYGGVMFPQNDVPQQQLPTPTLSNHSSTTTSNVQSKTSPGATSAPTGKKNKYPCPYAATHSCMATFTTSGHAARHGKKHTGEKGVHCPICNKAFTRKDNMKQHERTHKNQGSKNADDTSRSKAAITKDAQKAKAHKKTESGSSNHVRRSSMLQSPVSEVPSLGPNTVDTPVNVNNDAAFFHDQSPPLMIVPDPSLGPDPNAPSMYPPLADETLIPTTINARPEKIDSTVPMPPTLIRGFSDLDTLAQAAETFDPYYQHQYPTGL